VSIGLGIAVLPKVCNSSLATKADVESYLSLCPRDLPLGGRVLYPKHTRLEMIQAKTSSCPTEGRCLPDSGASLQSQSVKTFVFFLCKGNNDRSDYILNEADTLKADI
jgi:hypothetical protein